MKDLKPCPFCGRKAEIIKMGTGYRDGKYLATYAVRCPDCKVGFKHESEIDMRDGKPVIYKDGYQKCIDEWNRRAGDEKAL